MVRKSNRKYHDRVAGGYDEVRGCVRPGIEDSSRIIPRDAEVEVRVTP